MSRLRWVAGRGGGLTATLRVRGQALARLFVTSTTCASQHELDGRAVPDTRAVWTVFMGTAMEGVSDTCALAMRDAEACLAELLELAQLQVSSGSPGLSSTMLTPTVKHQFAQAARVPVDEVDDSDMPLWWALRSEGWVLWHHRQSDEQFILIRRRDGLRRRPQTLSEALNLIAALV